MVRLETPAFVGHARLSTANGRPLLTHGAFLGINGCQIFVLNLPKKLALLRGWEARKGKQVPLCDLPVGVMTSCFLHIGVQIVGVRSSLVNRDCPSAPRW